MEDVNKRRWKFLSISELGYDSLEFTATRKEFTSIWQSKRAGKIAIEIESTRIQFLNDVFADVVLVVLGTLQNYDGDGKENVKKAIGLMSKTTTLHVHHAFLYISLPSLHNYDVKWPNFKFTWERERQGDKFYHLGLNSGAVPSLQLQPKFLSFK